MYLEFKKFVKANSDTKPRIPSPIHWKNDRLPYIQCVYPKKIFPMTNVDMRKNTNQTKKKGEISPNPLKEELKETK